ncbi:hypothetical protein FP828_03705 [bacterium]|nr:hypothetical protein [Candidatus Omnitrophota bacterium]MBA3065578.1 hypothetical protein [bacterium]
MVTIKTTPKIGKEMLALSDKFRKNRARLMNAEYTRITKEVWEDWSVSYNHIGRRISSLKGLQRAVEQRRAVVVPKWSGFRKPNPAAWMINLNGAILVRLFDSGMYIYRTIKWE